MLAVNYSGLRGNLKSYCDLATFQDETILVTRKADNNVVMLSLEKYNSMLKALKNAHYLAMLDESMAQFSSGRAQAHELIEDDA